MNNVIKALCLSTYTTSIVLADAMQNQGMSLFDLSKRYQESARSLISKAPEVKAVNTQNKNIKDDLINRFNKIERAWNGNINIAKQLLEDKKFVEQVFEETIPDNAEICTQFILGLLKIYGTQPLTTDGITLEERFLKFVDILFLFEIASRTPKYDRLQFIKYFENFLGFSFGKKSESVKQMLSSHIINFQRLIKMKRFLQENLVNELSDFTNLCNTDYEQLLYGLRDGSVTWSNDLELDQIFLMTMFDHKKNGGNTLSVADLEILKKLALRRYKTSKWLTERTIESALSRKISFEELKMIQETYERMRWRLQDRKSRLSLLANKTYHTDMAHVSNSNMSVTQHRNTRQTLGRHDRARSNSRDGKQTERNMLNVQERTHQISSNYNDPLVPNTVMQFQQFGTEYPSVLNEPKNVLDVSKNVWLSLPKGYSYTDYIKLQNMILDLQNSCNNIQNIQPPVQNEQTLFDQSGESLPPPVEPHIPYVPQPVSESNYVPNGTQSVFLE